LNHSGTNESLNYSVSKSNNTYMNQRRESHFITASEAGSNTQESSIPSGQNPPTKIPEKMLLRHRSYLKSQLMKVSAPATTPKDSLYPILGPTYTFDPVTKNSIPTKKYTKSTTNVYVSPKNKLATQKKIAYQNNIDLPIDQDSVSNSSKGNLS
jgi:hypothetical protein